MSRIPLQNHYMDFHTMSGEIGELGCHACDICSRRNVKAFSRIASQYDVTNVRVFGSVQRDEDTEGSDVDLLVDFERGRNLLDQVGLKTGSRRFARMQGGCRHGGWFALVYTGQGPKGGKGIVKDDLLISYHYANISVHSYDNPV